MTAKLPSCCRPPGLPERKGEAQGPARAQAAVIPPHRLAAQRQPSSPHLASRHPGQRCRAAQRCLSACTASSAAAQFRIQLCHRLYPGRSCCAAQRRPSACRAETSAVPYQRSLHYRQGCCAAARSIRACIAVTAAAPSKPVLYPQEGCCAILRCLRGCQAYSGCNVSSA